MISSVIHCGPPRIIAPASLAHITYVQWLQFSGTRSLRKQTEAALAPKFDQKKFHDFVLGQGLLPPDLMRKAVLEEFISAQRD